MSAATPASVDYVDVFFAVCSPSSKGRMMQLSVSGRLLLIVTLLSPLQPVHGFCRPSTVAACPRQTKIGNSTSSKNSSSKECRGPRERRQYHDDWAYQQDLREKSNALHRTPRTACRTMSRKEIANVLVGLGTTGVALLHSQRTAEAATETSTTTAATQSPSIELGTARDAPLGVVRRDSRRTTAQAGLSSVRIGGEIDLALPAVDRRTKRIFLARHGQTDLNALMVCQGRRLDPPLNEKGRGQARRLLPHTRLDAIVCSPLRRARETAGIVRGSHPGTAVSVARELNEVDFGGAEGLPQPLAAAFLAPTYLAWSAGCWDKRAGRFGESGDQLRLRAAALAETLLDACDEGGQVLGVSHSSMIKFTLSTLLDVPLNTIRALGQDNCAVSALDFDAVSGVFNAVVINGQPMRGRAARFEGVA